MEKRHLEVLDEFTTDLKSSLNLSYLLPHLMKRKLLTTSEEHKLKNQAKSDHDNNGEFLDYLKTKGSRAFPLFLAALREETEHLGHVDLCERISQRARQAGIQIMFEALPETMENSLSLGVGSTHHSHSMSEPATRRESLDSSLGSPGSRAPSTAKIIHDDGFTDRLEKTQNSILQQLERWKGL